MADPESQEQPAFCRALHLLQLDHQAGDGEGEALSQSRGAQQLCVEGIVVSFWRSMFHQFFLNIAFF